MNIIEMYPEKYQELLEISKNIYSNSAIGKHLIDLTHGGNIEESAKNSLIQWFNNGAN